MAMDAKQLAAYLKGKSPEQKKVINYFSGNGGCLKKAMSDEEYDAMVMEKIKSSNFKQKALDQIGLDESEVAEIAPVNFSCYNFDGKVWSRLGKDNVWRSSSYQVTWLFFSATQVYLYQCTMNMDDGAKKEVTEEYFYKDVVNFTAVSETTETEIPKANCMGGVSWTRVNHEYDRFSIVVPGDKFYCSMKRTDTSEETIKGMKALLREKKNNG